jgi:hypothetical protein
MKHMIVIAASFFSLYGHHVFASGLSDKEEKKFEADYVDWLPSVDRIIGSIEKDRNESGYVYREPVAPIGEMILDYSRKNDLDWKFRQNRIHLLVQVDEIDHVLNDKNEILKIAAPYATYESETCQRAEEIIRERRLEDHRLTKDMRQLCQLHNFSDPYVTVYAPSKTIYKQSSTVMFTRKTWENTLGIRICDNFRDPGATMLCWMCPGLDVFAAAGDLTAAAITGAAGIAGLVSEPFVGWHYPYEVFQIHLSQIKSGQIHSVDDLKAAGGFYIGAVPKENIKE